MIIMALPRKKNLMIAELELPRIIESCSWGPSLVGTSLQGDGGGRQSAKPHFFHVQSREVK